VDVCCASGSVLLSSGELARSGVEESTGGGSVTDSLILSSPEPLKASVSPSPSPVWLGKCPPC